MYRGYHASHRLGRLCQLCGEIRQYHCTDAKHFDCPRHSSPSYHHHDLFSLICFICQFVTVSDIKLTWFINRNHDGSTGNPNFWTLANGLYLPIVCLLDFSVLVQRLRNHGQMGSLSGWCWLRCWGRLVKPPAWQMGKAIRGFAWRSVFIVANRKTYLAWRGELTHRRHKPFDSSLHGCDLFW